MNGTRGSTVPLTLRDTFRQREANCALFTDFVGSLRSWISDWERVERGGISGNSGGPCTIVRNVLVKLMKGDGRFMSTNEASLRQPPTNPNLVNI